MGGMGPRLSLEGKGRNRAQPLLSVSILPIPRGLFTEMFYGILHCLVKASRSFTGSKYLYDHPASRCI